MDSHTCGRRHGAGHSEALDAQGCLERLVLLKIAIYIVLLILSNVLSNYTVQGSVVGATQWIGTYLCVFMMVREAFSCVENIQAIYPILPPSFVKRLKDFNDRGEYTSEPQ